MVPSISGNGLTVRQREKASEIALDDIQLEETKLDQVCAPPVHLLASSSSKR
jgi:hypothetical protein